jgi:GNAT superfamily N-acetyltransferase
MEELTLSLEEGPDNGTAHIVEDIINEYNCSVMRSDYRPLQILLRNAQGEVVGGLLGKTEWGWLHIATLAIREEFRGQGYGTRLLAMAEAEAQARGCHDVFLDTFSFQARPFYEARGYELFGVLERFAEHTKFFLRKRLASEDR